MQAFAATHALHAEQWPGGIRLAVRCGLHTGEAERRGADYFGPTVNLEARLRGVLLDKLLDALRGVADRPDPEDG